MIHDAQIHTYVRAYLISYTHTHTHTHTHTSVSFKGDASHFKHFASLFKGFKVTHQSSAGYPASRVRDIKILGSTLCRCFLLAGHPEARVRAPASSLFCPFAIAPL